MKHMKKKGMAKGGMKKGYAAGGVAKPDFLDIDKETMIQSFMSKMNNEMRK